MFYNKVYSCIIARKVRAGELSMKSSVLKSKTLMIIAIIFIAIALICGIAATGAVANAENAETTVVTNVAHLSDLHIYPVNYSNPYSSGKVSALGSTKLMVQSEAVLETALKEVYDMGDNAPTVMLISGDLTSNGEYAGHVYLAETLKQFTAKMRNRTDTEKDFSSFQIFVMPGNHDLYNQHAISYMPSQEEIDACGSDEEKENLIRSYSSRSVRTTTSIDVFEIYSDFGYCNCDGRKLGNHGAECGMADGCKVNFFYESKYWYDDDTTRVTLSDGTVEYKGFDVKKPTDEQQALYEERGKDFEAIAEPARIGACAFVAELNGVTILGLDANSREYEGIKNNTEAELSSGGYHETTGGNVTQAMIRWMLEETKDDVKKNNLVLANCHYNLVPHFEMEDDVISLFVLDNWENVVNALSEAGIRYGFSGHQHASDVVDYVSPKGNVFYDNQAGALVSYAPAYKTHVFTQIKNVNGKAGTYAENMNSTIHYMKYNGSNVFNYDQYKLESDLTTNDVILGDQGVGSIIDELFVPNVDEGYDRTYLFDDYEGLVLVKNTLVGANGEATSVADFLASGLANMIPGMIGGYIGDGLYDMLRGFVEKLDWKYTKNLVLSLIDGLEELDLYQLIPASDGKSFSLSRKPKAGYHLTDYAQDLVDYLLNYDFGYGELDEKVTIDEILVIVYGAHLAGVSNKEIREEVQPLIDRLYDGTFVNFLIDTLVGGLVPQLQLIFDAPIRFNSKTAELSLGEGFDIVEAYNSSKTDGGVDGIVRMVLTTYCCKEVDSEGYSSLTNILKDVSKILEDVLTKDPSEIKDGTLKIIANVAKPLLASLGDIGSIVDMVMEYLNMYFESGSLYQVLDDALLSKYVTDAFCRNLGEYAGMIIEDLAHDDFEDGAEWIEDVDYMKEFIAKPIANYRVYTKQYDAKRAYLGYTYYRKADGSDNLSVAPTKENGLIPSMVTVSFAGDATTEKKFQWFTSIPTNEFDKNDKGEYEYSVPDSYIEYSTNIDMSDATVVKANGVNVEKELPTIDLGILYFNLTHRYKVYNKYDIKLTDLKPATTYYYRLGNDEYGWTKVSTFATADGDDEFTFTAITDIQGSVKSNYTNSAPYVEEAVKDGTEFVINCGDNVDNGKSIYQYSWWLDEQYKVWQNNTLVTLAGNHEDENYSLSDIVAIPDGAVVNDCGYYYSYNYGNVHFVIVDTNDLDSENNLNKAQLDWLIADLESNKQQWTIVALHKGPYTAGSHAFDKDVIALRQQLTPIFAEYGVDVVLQGHDHTYSVSEYIGADGKPVEVSYKDGKAKNPDGVLYINLGTIGDKFYDYIYSEEVYLKQRTEAPKGLEKYFADGKLELTETPVYATVNVKGKELSIVTYTIVDGQSVVVDEIAITKGGININLPELNTNQTLTYGIVGGCFVSLVILIIVGAHVNKVKKFKKKQRM